MARILIVEDDRELGPLLVRALEHETHTVALESDGTSALLHVREHEPELVILDVMLPGMNGFEVCRRIREFGVDAPVIMMTARDGIDDRVAGLDAGADDYVPKPVAVPELAARVRAQLRRREAAPVTALEHGDLALDLVTDRLAVSGKPCQLSAKEFQLLRDLIEHAGENRSRTDILTSVWGSAEHFDSSIVDQYVSYLRRKLGRAESQVAITTVRGVGYRLETDASDAAVKG